MKCRVLASLLAAVLTGCGQSQTASTAPPKAEKLPPEVELDPETAAKHYQAAGKRPAGR